MLNENLRKNGMIETLQSYLKIDSDAPQPTWWFEGPGDRRILHVSLPTLEVSKVLGGDALIFDPPSKEGAQLMIDGMVGLGLVVVE